jgi:CheY-like chemotaxis protein
VSAYLRDCGFKVIEASDADEAFAVLQTDVKLAVVFSDVQSPAMASGSPSG